MDKWRNNTDVNYSLTDEYVLAWAFGLAEDFVVVAVKAVHITGGDEQLTALPGCKTRNVCTLINEILNDLNLKENCVADSFPYPAYIEVMKM